MINLKNIVFFIGICSFFLCLFGEGNIAYKTIFLLPLTFVAVSGLYYKTYDLMKNSFVFNIFILQAILRYFIIPYKVSDGDYMIGVHSEYGETAIFVMMLEIFLCFIFLHFVATKQKDQFLNKTQKIIFLEGSPVLYALIGFLAFHIYSSGFLSRVNPIWNMSEYVQKMVEGEEFGDSGFGGILFGPFKVIVALFFISLVHKSKIISYEMKKYGYLMVIFIASLFILGTSRLSILRFAIPLLVMVTLIIDRKSSRKLILTFIAFIIPIILITSISKFSRQGNQVATDSFFKLSSLNAYFAGPGNVAVGMEAYEQLEIKDKALFFVNDLLQNFPGLSKYSSDSYKTNTLFNEKIHGHRLYQDQIAPLSISGIFHFGYWGSFIYAPLFLLIALYMERKSYSEHFLSYKYVYITISISLSMVFMLNIGSLYFNIVSSILFIYIPFLIINVLKKIGL